MANHLVRSSSSLRSMQIQIAIDQFNSFCTVTPFIRRFDCKIIGGASKGLFGFLKFWVAKLFGCSCSPKTFYVGVYIYSCVYKIKTTFICISSFINFLFAFKLHKISSILDYLVATLFLLQLQGEQLRFKFFPLR